jgi:hypothetical protein
MIDQSVLGFNNPMAPAGPQSFQAPFGDFTRSNPIGFVNKDAYFDDYKPFYNQGMPHVFLDEWSYTVDKKKLDSIVENIDTFYEEIPFDDKHVISFGKLVFDHGLLIDCIERETDKLRDSSNYVTSRVRRSGQTYNLDLLNEMSGKIKSWDEISVEDLQLLIFLVQRTISDMKSVGRTGRGYGLAAYELRRRGFQVNPKELLEFLEKMKYR